MWRADVLTLFPDLFPGPLGASILGRARGEGLWDLACTDIRAFSDNRYGSVDDTPAGGGAGLVMRADILHAALSSVDRAGRPFLYMSPRGRRFDQAAARDLAAGPGAVVLCGRFEGVDQRFLDHHEAVEISLGDFVLAGGEIAAMALIEACVRLIPGVLGCAQSLGEESFSRGPGGECLLEYPHFTRPRVFEGREIPAVLLSGDHERIARWRRDEALKLTRARRPDLLPDLAAGERSGPIRAENNTDDTVDADDKDDAT